MRLLVTIGGFLLLVPFGGVWWLYALTCAWPAVDHQNIVLQALAISDAHLLGNRKRSKLDRLWTDWSLQMSFAMVTLRFQPDVVLNIGDVLDEGKRATPTQYTSYMDRSRQIFFRGNTATNHAPTSSSTTSTTSTTSTATAFSSLFSTQTLPHYTTVGNHDIGWRFLNDRRLFTFERDHQHASNAFFQIHNLTFARINSMALHPDAIQTPGGKKHREAIEQMLGTNRHVDVLLTHQPLYRRNDLNCGSERKEDFKNGGVTYWPASKTLIADDDVINEEYTRRILQQWTPTTVLSGHLHSVCRVQHTTSSQELTIPTFSWRMRPDPKYFLISFEKSGAMHATQCNLPHEHVFMVGAVLGVCVVVVVVCIEVCKKKNTKGVVRKQL